MTMRSHSLASPLGRIFVTAEGDSLTALRWTPDQISTPATSDPLLQEAERQLVAYFDRRLTRFDLPLQVRGSAFQQAVCAAMSAIPPGETRTYGDLARMLGVPAQAIGQACGGNPIPIIIPCHRVLGRSGLGGFSSQGGVESKVWLLRHEGAAGLLI